MIAWRNIEAPAAHALVEFCAKYRPFLSIHTGDALVERARSTVATQFLASQDDVLLTIDSDILFDPEDAYTICRQAYDLRAIVAGVYSTRSWAKGAPSSLLNETPVVFDTDPTPVEVRWAASGFMAIHRSVFEVMAARRPDMRMCHQGQGAAFQFMPFYHTRFADGPDGERILLSEDFSLCENARELGISTYVNPAVRLGHVGTMVYRLEHMGWKEPPVMPMRLTRDGLRYAVEADVPADLLVFAKGAR